MKEIWKKKDWNSIISMFVLHKIEAGISCAQVRVSRAVQGFLNNVFFEIYLNWRIKILMMHVVWRPYYLAIKQFSLSDNNLNSDLVLLPVLVRKNDVHWSKQFQKLFDIISLRGVCLTVRVICLLIQLHKSACFSALCKRTESVNKIWDNFLVIFTLDMGRRTVFPACFLFFMCLRKRNFV